MLKKLAILFATSVVLLSLISCEQKTEVSIDEAAQSTASPEFTTDLLNPTDSVSEGLLPSEPTAMGIDNPSPSIDIDYQNIKPYEVGQVMVIMYHAIVEEEARDSWQRSVKDFKNDLQMLYDNGFRLCSLKDLTENNITVEAGYTPVVITFDDGLSQSFSLIERDGKLVPKENTGIYLMEQFAASHPDFGCTATLYINGDNNIFSGDGTIAERLKWLVNNGYDIGNHTYSHAHLNKKTSDEIQMEIGTVDQLIKESIPGYIPVGISYPYGERPSEELLKYILHGEYNGEPYSYDFALKEGYNAAKPAVPNRTGYDAYSISRVRGSSDADTDLGYFLNYYQENPEYRYISDGNPDTICVQEQFKDNVNMDSLRNKKLITYIIE